MVARATSAAPGYFREMHIEGREFIDGAIGFNNPTEELCDEVEYLYGAKANSLILSIGTGIHEHSSLKFGGPVGVIADALRMAIDCQRIHKNMEQRCDREEGFGYYRLNVEDPQLGDIKLGAYRELPRIKTITEHYLSMSDVSKRLHEVAEILVKNRRDRISQNKDRWEAFCCDTRYQCIRGPHKRCQYGYHERTRHRFVEHLKRDHEIIDDNERERIIEESKNIFIEVMARRAFTVM
jgi:hypothetical protein